MRNIKPGLALLVAAALLAGCAPAVTVNNTTTFAVRVFVTGTEGKSVVSPTPGESSIAVVGSGRYSAAAILDAEWINYAKLVRADLNEQLANADNLSGAKLLDLVRRLKDIAAQMKAYETAAQGAGAACSGLVKDDGVGTVTVSQAANGNLAVSCR